MRLRELIMSPAAEARQEVEGLCSSNLIRETKEWSGSRLRWKDQ